MKRFISALLGLCLCLCLTACSDGKEKRQTDFFAMDTTMSMTIYGPEGEAVLRQSQQEIQRLEALLSRTREDSPVSVLNRGECVENEELSGLLRQAMQLSESVGGSFDVTIAPVVSAWGFTTEAYRVPTEEERSQLLEAVGGEHVNIQENSITLDPGTGVDFGGIAKGYASDRIAQLWKEQGVSSGIASLGGNIYVCGRKPDGSDWQVAVRDPDGEGYLGILRLHDSFAVTSGSYERYFVGEDGKIYHHIIDPKTGAPADSGLVSVTVVGSSGTRCDALSTALFVMGAEQAADYWRQQGKDFDMILLDRDGRVQVTKGLEQCFDSEERGKYRYEIIR